jgi:hypothetical protein
MGGHANPSMSARRCVECGANETLCNAPLLGSATYSMDVMSIETIGEAHSLGWRVIARCTYSRGDGPSSKSSRECIYRKELDMETLVWTRGRAFPLSRLESRLRCPQCGSRQIVVLFDPPANVAAAKCR